MSNDRTRSHSYRCSICHINWPFIALYRECPQCRKPNSFGNVKVEEVISVAEAQRLSRYFNFEYYCETEYVPVDADLDPELEARLEKHVKEVNQARKEGRPYPKYDAFDALIDGQFDEETRVRIVKIESIMRGREHYELLQDPETENSSPPDEE